MMKSKRKSKPVSNRVIPSPDLGSYTPPDLIAAPNLTTSDRAAVERLRSDFMESGVIERNPMGRDQQSIDEINAIMGEAAENAKYERELNPEYYDAELDSSLGGDLAPEDDWDNPILDGVDDYGNQIHESRSLSKRDISTNTNSSPGDKDLLLRLENGEIIRARII